MGARRGRSKRGDEAGRASLVIAGVAAALALLGWLVGRGPAEGRAVAAPEMNAPDREPQAAFGQESTPVSIAPQLVAPERGSPSQGALTDEARMLAAVRAAKADPSDVGLATLVAHLASDDAVVVAEAADGLVARRAVDAIPAIAAIDPHKTPGAGLSLIDALGRLGGMAKGANRDQAVSRLVALMNEERTRGAPDSAGNLVQLYESLGETSDPRAAASLEAALEDASVKRAPKVAIVKSLERIGAPTSRAPIERERARTVARSEPDAFEEEIRQDLVQAMDRALSSLP